MNKMVQVWGQPMIFGGGASERWVSYFNRTFARFEGLLIELVLEITLADCRDEDPKANCDQTFSYRCLATPFDGLIQQL